MLGLKVSEIDPLDVAPYNHKQARIDQGQQHHTSYLSSHARARLGVGIIQNSARFG
jgi:hypothetical protein